MAMSVSVVVKEITVNRVKVLQQIAILIKTMRNLQMMIVMLTLKIVNSASNYRNDVIIINKRTQNCA